MQDLSKAFKFFSLAAEQGWVDGQLQLGIMYYSMLTFVIILVVLYDVFKLCLLISKCCTAFHHSTARTSVSTADDKGCHQLCIVDFYTFSALN